VNLELEPDPLADYDDCIPGCRICLDACPAQALDGVTIVQKKCRAVSTKATPGGGAVLACNKCRKICPNHKGIRR
jgi:epoxyqueuosine reductase QueG